MIEELLITINYSKVKQYIDGLNYIFKWYGIFIIKHPARTINMIYLIVLTFNWEPDAIIKLKQLSKVK